MGSITRRLLVLKESLLEFEVMQITVGCLSQWHTDVQEKTDSFTIVPRGKASMSKAISCISQMIEFFLR